MGNVMVNLHRSIREEYDRLCVRFRELVCEIERGDAICAHCQNGWPLTIAAGDVRIS